MNNDEKKQKKTYAKPRLTTIDLVAEDIMKSGSCKSSSQAGGPKFNPTCQMTSGCHNLGSG